jgi:hypothetical protein
VAWQAGDARVKKTCGEFLRICGGICSWKKKIASAWHVGPALADELSPTVGAHK